MQCFIIYGCLGNSFLLDYCTVVIKIASLIFETQSLILFYIFLFIFCCYAASFTYIFLMWNPYSIIQLISCYNIFRASCSPIAYMIPVYVYNKSVIMKMHLNAVTWRMLMHEQANMNCFQNYFLFEIFFLFPLDNLQF